VAPVLLWPGVLFVSGVNVDRIEAAHSFKVWLDQGNSFGELWYGVYLVRGFGIPADPSLIFYKVFHTSSP
jgi:hypothetical protein